MTGQGQRQGNHHHEISQYHLDPQARHTGDICSVRGFKIKGRYTTALLIDEPLYPSDPEDGYVLDGE